jgi:hypothetical protein
VQVFLGGRPQTLKLSKRSIFTMTLAPVSSQWLLFMVVVTIWMLLRVKTLDGVYSMPRAMRNVMTPEHRNYRTTRVSWTGDAARVGGQHHIQQQCQRAGGTAHSTCCLLQPR